MKWKKFRLETLSAAEDVVSGILADNGVEGVEIEDKVPLSESDKARMFVDIPLDPGADDGIAYVTFYLDEEADSESVLRAVQTDLEETREYMRRYMMKIAEYFAEQDKCLGMITGESIGQVASQTMQSLAATNEVCRMPVYRPLIGFDKTDIIKISQKIGAFETSIQPFEDCCTIFVAKHPVTKPNIAAINRSELKLREEIDNMFNRAVETADKLVIK